MKKLHIRSTSFFNVLETTERSQVAEMMLDPGRSTGGPINRHENSDQWMYIISGRGKAIIDNNQVDLKSGDLLLIEAGENHEIVNEGKEKLKTFNIYSPPEY
jgi:mannose-6-phosphate isomerase-like protein (cupin superfamily)